MDRLKSFIILVTQVSGYRETIVSAVFSFRWPSRLLAMGSLLVADEIQVNFLLFKEDVHILAVHHSHIYFLHEEQKAKLTREIFFTKFLYLTLFGPFFRGSKFPLPLSRYEEGLLNHANRVKERGRVKKVDTKRVKQDISREGEVKCKRVCQLYTRSSLSHTHNTAAHEF